MYRMIKNSICYGVFVSMLFVFTACKPDIPQTSLTRCVFTFTDEEIAAQETAGALIMEDIRTAAKDLSISEYTIPPGDYGYKLKTDFGGVKTGFILYGVDRPDDNPFTIRGDGATLWFHTTGLPSAYLGKCFTLINCSNIIVDGLTIDSYEKNTIDGKLISVDKTNNQMEIELFPDTLDDPLKMYRLGSDSRIVPVKSGGDFISPYYKINNNYGPGLCHINKLEKGTADNRMIITLKNEGLLDTMDDPNWMEAYGTDGTLEIGDDIAVIYGVQLAISLDNCKQITVQNLDCYMTRGGFWENGGYGNHKWINCRFDQRPGSTAILGGDGNMSQWLRFGSTYDGLYVGTTTDDIFNIHGLWSRVTSVSGNNATFDLAPCSVLGGDKVMFYDQTGKLAATCSVVQTPKASISWCGQLNNVKIELSGNIPDNPGDYFIRWPESECDNWTIKNSTFDGTYQRILIQSGPGLLENNIIRNMGSCIEIKNATADIETGFAGDITIRNNVFINSCIHPGGVLVRISSPNNWYPREVLHNITLTENVFLGTGNSLVNTSGLDGLTITKNVIIDPVRYTALANPGGYNVSSCVMLINTINTRIEDNYLIQQTLYTSSDPDIAFVNNPSLADLIDNRMYTDPQNSVRIAIMEAAEQKDAEAAAIYDEIWELASKFIQH